MATRIRNVTVDATVEADLEGGLSSWRRYTPSERAAALEGLAKEFNDFIRDHRSMDHVHLTVNRVVRDECSACRNEYEADGDMCAWCGAMLAEVPADA